MPRMDDLLNAVGKSKFVSKIDLKKGYWQIPLDEDTKQKSSFVTPMGQYRFTVMPFGMVNAPATFVRMMNKVLEGCSGFAESFIDDIGIYSQPWEEHLEHIRFVCERLREANLSAKPSKCTFGHSKLEYLGHIVGGGTVMPTVDKIESIKNFQIPSTKKQVRSFLGTIGFYRKFVDNFSVKALPLTNLTKKEQPTKVKWQDFHQKAFDDLKAQSGGDSTSCFAKPGFLASVLRVH